MANYLHPDVLDNGLVTLTNATSTVLHLCSGTQPTTRATAISQSVANKASPTISSPTARTPDGRKVTIAAVTDGTVTVTATETCWALIDGTRLLAVGDSNDQAMTSGNVMTCTAIDIGIPGAV
jgi:hypothetical protein